tara:strand:- start:5585 stop:6049 length:465 start_codon:yes stop_codon:yes gene_type:complete
MKNHILLLTFFIFNQIGISQVDVNIDKTTSLEQEVDGNYSPYDYISNGVYKFSVTNNYQTNTRRHYQDKQDEFEKFIEQNKYTYDVICEEILDEVPPYVYTFIFKLKDYLGNPLITKSEATKEIIKLKELLDLGVLSQNEYDNKAKVLKAIILK